MKKTIPQTRPSGTLALIIGRAGSSLLGKNLIPILGSTSSAWVASAAKRCGAIDEFYASSDSPEILAECESFDFTKIHRPPGLATGTAKGCDVVNHALNHIAETAGRRFEILILLHANAPTVQTSEIEVALNILSGDSSATAAVPAFVEQDRHPYRAKKWNADGTLESFFPGIQVSSNRQELPSAMFLAHSFWAIRLQDGLTPADGESPWNCLGRKVIGFEVESRSDIHTLDDVRSAEAWLRLHEIQKPLKG